MRHKRGRCLSSVLLLLLNNINNKEVSHNNISNKDNNEIISTSNGHLPIIKRYTSKLLPKKMSSVATGMAKAIIIRSAGLCGRFSSSMNLSSSASSRPKRPPTAFLSFLSDFRPRNAHLSLTEASREAASRWSAMNEDEKRPYMDKTEREMATWKENMAKYEKQKKAFIEPSEFSAVCCLAGNAEHINVLKLN